MAGTWRNNSCCTKACAQVAVQGHFLGRLRDLPSCFALTTSRGLLGLTEFCAYQVRLQSTLVKVGVLFRKAFFAVSGMLVRDSRQVQAKPDQARQNPEVRRCKQLFMEPFEGLLAAHSMPPAKPKKQMKRAS